MNPDDILGLDTSNAGPKQPDKPIRPLLEHIEGHDYALRIDNSMLEVFQTCPRSALYYAVRRRQAPASPALAFGGAIHEGLALFYRQGFNKATLVEAQAAVNNFLALNPIPPEQWRTPELAVEVITDYYNHYGTIDPLRPIILPDGSPCVENKFSLALGIMPINAEVPFPTSTITDAQYDSPTTRINNIHILWTGRMDLGCTGVTSLPCVCDHKTSSIGGKTFFEDFRLSQQTIGYCWALSQIIAQPVNTFILNAIIQRKPSRTGKNRTLERMTYRYDHDQIREWQCDVMCWVGLFVDSLCTSYFPKNTKWCMGKYGRCQYHDVCTLTGQERDIMLNSQVFENVSWSPLN